PEMDGFELAEHIRRADRRRYVPLVFVTAVARNDLQRSKGYSVGAVDYLVKPLDAEIVQAKVGAFVELYRKTEKLHETELELRRLNQELGTRVEERTHELKQSLETLKTLKDRFVLAQQASNLVTWEWEIKHHVIHWSEN